MLGNIVGTIFVWSNTLCYNIPNKRKAILLPISKDGEDEEQHLEALPISKDDDEDEGGDQESFLISKDEG